MKTEILAVVFIEGLIFILLTVTSIREAIVDAIPHTMKTAISAGIGLFIAFIGLQNAGMVGPDGKIARIKQSFLADAIATTAGACMGVSATTTYVESVAGVAQGGRTGLYCNDNDAADILYSGGCTAWHDQLCSYKLPVWKLQAESRTQACLKVCRGAA